MKWLGSSVTPSPLTLSQSTPVVQPPLIEQVDDQLQLVHALEVGHLRLIAGFDERVEARLHQGAHTAAEHGLLAEQVGLGFLSPILTGVVYRDRDRDAFYTPGGEGLGGVSVIARAANGLTLRTTTFPSGGYSVTL